MSRWQTEFERHPFQADWRALIAEIPELEVDDSTVTTSVEEVTRFKRVVAYMEALIGTLDVELVPKNIWDSFHAQCSPCLEQIRAFRTNRNIEHVKNANAHLDNLLSYVRPFMALPEDTVKILSYAAKNYRDQLDAYVAAFLEASTARTRKIADLVEQSTVLYANAQENKEKISAFATELTGSGEGTDSLQAIIHDTKLTIDSQASEISEFHRQLLVGNGDNAPSTKATIEDALKAVQAAESEIDSRMSESAEQTSRLNTFHAKIFGKKESDGTITGGLERELDNRIQQLTNMEVDHTQKYKALQTKIENLLPGATSAGLAKAYDDLRRNFAKPVRTNTLLFYVAVGLMPTVALIASVQHFSVWPFDVTLAPLPDNYEAILKSIIVKIPFIAPLIWLAVFASIRRSQYERLQQEYAHKGALAKSYESYKRQLSLLAAEGEPLQKELIAKAIDAIAFNASSTLDGKHIDKSPIEHAVEILTDEKKKGVLDKLKHALGLQ